MRHLSRHLASLLLLASPAVGGTLVPLGHPCPVEAPWVGVAPAMDAAATPLDLAHAHHAPAAPAHEGDRGDGHHDCSCIGSCATPAALQAPANPVALTAAVFPRRAVAVWPRVEIGDAARIPADYLPLPTAPPLA